MARKRPEARQVLCEARAPQGARHGGKDGSPLLADRQAMRGLGEPGVVACGTLAGERTAGVEVEGGQGDVGGPERQHVLNGLHGGGLRLTGNACEQGERQVELTRGAEHSLRDPHGLGAHEAPQLAGLGGA